MENTKELVRAILEGKDYSEAFKTVMAEKIKTLLENKKAEVSGVLFSEQKSHCDCDHPEKDMYGKCKVCKCKIKEEVELEEEADLTKIPSAQLRQTAKLHRLRGTPESIKAAERGEAELKRRQMKEEAELQESELSDEEMKRREEIVMSMKKNIPDLKKRYGDRWKEVMYATATKLAKKGS